jgi:hypothetical protein
MSNIQENKIAPICQYEIASPPTTITIPDDTTTSMTTTSAAVVACIGKEKSLMATCIFSLILLSV